MSACSPPSARALVLLSAPTVMAAPAREAPWAAWKTIVTAHYRIPYPNEWPASPA